MVLRSLFTRTHPRDAPHESAHRLRRVLDSGVLLGHLVHRMGEYDDREFSFECRGRGEEPIETGISVVSPATCGSRRSLQEASIRRPLPPHAARNGTGGEARDAAPFWQGS